MDKVTASATMVTCQWCDSADTYVSGYSPLCIETQYKCKNCHSETWHNDNEVSRTDDN